MDIDQSKEPLRKLRMKTDEAQGSDDSAQVKALKALVAKQDADLATQAEALAAKDEALAAKDETITTQSEALAEKDEALAMKDKTITTLQQITPASTAATAPTAHLPDDPASTDCEARARELLATTTRLSEPIKEGLARCRALRASIPIKRGETAAALQVERAQIIRDVTRAVDNGLANQLFHVDTSIRRMRHSIDLQQMPLQNMIKQIDDAAALANAAISSAEIASFGSRLDATARSLQLANTESALPGILDALYEMEATMRFAVDTTAWPRARSSAMQAVERLIVGIATARCGRHPIIEILQKPNVMRRIMALVAPTSRSRRAERQQWARKVLALEPVMHQLPIVVSVVATAQASSVVFSADSAAASDAPGVASSGAVTATQALSLVNVVAKDFLDKCTSFTAPGVEWADKVNPWLAMAAMAEPRVTVQGHTGVRAGMMGVYKRNDEHSTEGEDVYTNEVLSDLHLFRATNRKWIVGTTEDMVEGESVGWIMSTTVSDSFHDLKWKFYYTPRKTGKSTSTAWRDDPLLKVTETTAADYGDDC